MMFLKLRIPAAVVLWLTVASAAAETHLLKIHDGVFYRAGHDGEIFVDATIANLGVVVGERCVAVIDTGGSRAEGLDLLQAIRQLTDKPVCYVINTHIHPDHSLGNSAFRQGNTQFVAHANYSRALSILGPVYIERAREAMPDAEAGMNWLVKPDRVVFDEETLDLGGRTLQLIALEKGHSDQDLLVIDRQSEVVFGGDSLFHQHVPVVGGSGSIVGWLDQHPMLQGVALKHWLPGHGDLLSSPQATSAALLAQQGYLESLRKQVRDWIDNQRDLGSAVEQLGKAPAGDWHQFTLFHPRNVSYVYRELEWE